MYNEFMKRFSKWLSIVALVYLGIGVILSLWDGGINVAVILLWPWGVAMGVGFELAEMGILF